ncbi:MAG: recombinase family protein [Hoeflea sp.]|uniref:recombinase family protein n=1 Tax=Hoeflea sp. TaxID=1940281 RepID=UPI0032986D0A
MKKVRCAIYTRKSSEEGLDQDFNSLDAQREACSAYISSQKQEGWVLLDKHYDDGGLSGGTMNRPALQRLLQDVDEGLVDQIVVYKIDRLTRSLTDFAKLVDRLDKQNTSFVSVTQSFNTATSMGRLTLNVLLSFAQFEREVTAERIRDKIAASKKKGMWMGGLVPLGYRANGRTLEIDPEEAKTVAKLFELYLELGTVAAVKDQADVHGLATRKRTTKSGKMFGGKPFDVSHLHAVLTNPIYCGQIRHKNQIYQGLHPAIINQETWEKVQLLLAGNAAYERGKGTRVTAPSPLMGKLFDEAGKKLVPSHAKKEGRRYRYYVSQDRIKPSPKCRDNSSNQTAGTDGWRLAAPDLEAKLSAAIHQHLNTKGAIGLLDKPVSDVSTIDLVDRQLAGMCGKPDNETLDHVKRCTLEPGCLSLELECEALARQINVPPAKINPSALRTTLPFTRRKRGVEGKLIIGASSGKPKDTSTAKDKTLIKNIRSANRWYQAVQDGKSFTEIATSDAVSANTVQRMITLAFLAPDIVRDIFEGKQPVALTSDWLLRQTLPSDFEEQRAVIRSLG